MSEKSSSTQILPAKPTLDMTSIFLVPFSVRHIKVQLYNVFDKAKYSSAVKQKGAKRKCSAHHYPSREECAFDIQDKMKWGILEIITNLILTENYCLKFNFK